jgi:hypothetical protein
MKWLPRGLGHGREVLGIGITLPFSPTAFFPAKSYQSMNWDFPLHRKSWKPRQLNLPWISPRRGFSHGSGRCVASVHRVTMLFSAVMSSSDK